MARSQFNGTVTDSAGGVLVGATVIATNVETNVASKATTTDAGVYVIPYLPNGLYRIRVEATGFRPAQAEQVTLRAAQTLTLDFKLDVDAIVEAVTVSAPVIETSTAEIGHYVSNKEFQTWPIPVADGQRQVQQFIFSSLPGSTGGTFEGAINGGRNYSHEILVEGIPLGRNLQGGSNNEMSPPTEMVGEFKLQTGTLGAEFGGGQTAVANFVVKSGTNDFHGSGAFYLQDSSMDARPFQAKALGQNLPEREQQNWAVAVGGPIMLPKYNGKNRSFFYASFEKTHAEDQTSTSFRTLPTREFQNGDFSRLFDPAYTGDARSGTVIGTDALGRSVRFGQIYDPRTTRVVDGRVTRDPFPNNQIPRGMWDTVARNTLDQGLWDAPELDRLLNNQPQLSGCCPIFDQKTFATKYDQVLNDKHKLSFYVNREWRERNNSPAGRYGPPPGSPTNLYQLQSTPSWMIRATENWVISDRFLHRFAFGYNRFGNANRSVYFNAGWPSKIGLTNQPDTTFPRFAITGASAILGTLGNYGSLNRNETFEGSTIIQDDLTIIMGKHSIKTGFEGRFYYLESDSADGTATYNFNSAQTNLPGFDTQTGHAYGSFLLGAVQTSSRPVQIVNNSYYQNNYDFYVQDDYKVSPKLTLNLGVRWQILPGLYEKNGYVTNLDLTLPNTAAGNLPGALRFAEKEGEKTFIDTYYGQVQPRLGVAYAVSPQMALSGGLQLEQPPGAGLRRRRKFRHPELDRLQRQHLDHPRHAADAERAGSGHGLERAVSHLHGDVSELRPDATEQPGGRDGAQGRRGETRTVQQLQRDDAPSAAGELLDDHRVHRRLRHALDLHAPRSRCRQRDQSHAVRRDRRGMATCCSAICRRSRDSAFRCRIPVSPAPCSRRCGPIRSSRASSGRTASEARHATTRCRPRWNGISGTTSPCSSPTPCPRRKTTCSRRTGRVTSGRLRRTGISRTSSSSPGSTSCRWVQVRRSTSTACSDRSSAAGRLPASTITGAATRWACPTVVSTAPGTRSVLMSCRVPIPSSTTDRRSIWRAARRI